MNSLPMPPWLAKWPITFPCSKGAWTVRNDDHWGALIPETGRVSIVDPAADPALPGLRPALASGKLISYRVGRRAVVAAEDSFIKVVRPKRVVKVVGNHEAVGRRALCTVPEVVDHEPDGRITVTTIGGNSLHQKLRYGCFDEQCEDAQCLNAGDLSLVAAGVAGLHDQAPPDDIADLAGAGDWLDTVERFQDSRAGFLRAVHEQIPKTPSARSSIVHGDLHDKNVFLGNNGAALIDLDGVAAGPAEVDLGNLTAHIMLRALQAGVGESAGLVQVSEFLEAYRRRRSFNAEIVDAVQRQTWLRLSGLYQFRQASRHLVPLLVDMAAVRNREGATSGD